MKRFKTDYPSVYYIMGISPATGKEERIYYIKYRKNGKLGEVKAGRQIEDAMAPARTALKRSEKISGKIPTNQEERYHKRVEKEAEKGRWTIDKSCAEYNKQCCVFCDFIEILWRVNTQNSLPLTACHNLL
jgi:hypothetical protein